MNNLLGFEEIHKDCLHELIHISYGLANEKIREKLDTFVKLNIPRIKIMEYSSLDKYLTDQFDFHKTQLVSTQLVNGDIDVQNLFILDNKALEYLDNNLLLKGCDKTNVNSIILEVTNILSSATIDKLVKLLSTKVTLSMPCIHSINNIEELGNDIIKEYEQIIVISTEFIFGDCNIQGEFLVLTKTDSMINIKKALDKLLEEY